MKIYNSLTDKKEEFKPLKPNHISMYVCGPTTYNYVHIGNMRPVITFEVVNNYFKYLGYEVEYVSNFTDVNEKINNKAEELGLSPREVADKFICAYLKDVSDYNCSGVLKRPKVSDNIDNIIKFIQQLISNGYAYEVQGDVYFCVNKIQDYGILSNQDLEQLKNGVRKEVDSKKKNPLDFVLWRKTTNQENFASPWGRGIPGWHTECVVMINQIMGKKIDIHGGGIDLKFPHHENEIAQSIALNNNYIANYWMHNGHINVNNEKMSKSANNFILAKDFLKEHSANEIKIAFLKTHYRLPINLTDSLFKEARIINQKISYVLKQAKVQIDLNNYKLTNLSEDKKLEEIMNDDFNTPNVIAYLMDLVKTLNNELRLQQEGFIIYYEKILLINKILGLKFEKIQLSEEDKKNYNLWQQARKNKDYQMADNLREKLTKRGIL